MLLSVSDKSVVMRLSQFASDRRVNGLLNCQLSFVLRCEVVSGIATSMQ